MIVCSKGHRMILRLATKGKNQGKHFYGCIEYPNCREVKSVEDASPKIVVSADLKKTQEVRYKKMLEWINKIWQKEKQKLILRNKLDIARGEIKEGLRANLVINRSDSSMASVAYISVAQKKEEAIKKEIKEIQDKQLEELKEIENNIIRI